MLTERDIENLLEKKGSEATTWSRRYDPAIPKARNWVSADDRWLIQYIPDPANPFLGIGRVGERDAVIAYVPRVSDPVASKLLRVAAIDPGTMMETLQEEVDSSETERYTLPD